MRSDEIRRDQMRSDEMGGREMISTITRDAGATGAMTTPSKQQGTTGSASFCHHLRRPRPLVRFCEGRGLANVSPCSTEAALTVEGIVRGVEDEVLEHREQLGQRFLEEDWSFAAQRTRSAQEEAKMRQKKKRQERRETKGRRLKAEEVEGTGRAFELRQRSRKLQLAALN